MAAPTDYIAFYPLKTDANDETSNHNGTNVGAVFDGESAFFDGVDDRITLPISLSNALDGKSAASFSLWVSRSLYTSDDTVFSITTSAANAKIQILIQSDDTIRLGGRSDSSDGWSSCTSNNRITTDDWVHIVGVYELPSDTMVIYVNGVLDTTTAGQVFGYDTFQHGSGGSTDTMGSYLNATGYWFGGYLRDVRVYGRELALTEVEEIYSEESLVMIFSVFLDVSEDIAMVAESFLDVSQDELPTYQIFQDISTDDILITEIFQDLSADHQGHIEIFTDVSINEGDIAWGRFYDISEDIPESYLTTIIKRINE